MSRDKNESGGSGKKHAVPPELAAAYPDCPLALEWAESTHARNSKIWDQLREAGCSPAQARDSLLLAAAVAGASVAARAGGGPGPEDLVVRLLTDLAHPNFLKYVAARLGAV